MYTLKFTHRFKADVREAISYIRNTLKSSEAAATLVQEIKDKTQALTCFPFSVPLVRDEFLAAQGIRFTPIGNYMLFFRVDIENDVVEVLRFLYGRREWNNLTAIQDSPLSE